MTEVASLCRVLHDNARTLANLIALGDIEIDEAMEQTAKVARAVFRAAERLRLQAERMAPAKKKAP